MSSINSETIDDIIMHIFGKFGHSLQFLQKSPTKKNLKNPQMFEDISEDVLGQKGERRANGWANLSTVFFW